MLQCPLLLHLHLCLAFQRCRQKRLSAARIRKAVCLLPVITKKPHKKIPLHSSRHNNMIVVIDINHTNNTIPCQSHLYHRINSRPASLTSAFSEDRCRAWWQTYAGTRKTELCCDNYPRSTLSLSLCSLLSAPRAPCAAAGHDRCHDLQQRWNVILPTCLQSIGPERMLSLSLSSLPAPSLSIPSLPK